MALNDLYNLTIFLSGPASSGSIVLGYRQNGGSNGPNTLQSACEFFVANQALVLRTALSTECTLREVQMHQVSVGNEIPGIESTAGLVGTRVGNSLPWGAASVLTKITNAPNAKFNGRVFIPGISEDDVLDGIITSALATILIAVGVEILATVSTSLPETATFAPVVISRFLDGIPRVPPVAFDILNVRVRTTMNQQRRRITRERGVLS